MWLRLQVYQQIYWNVLTPSFDDFTENPVLQELRDLDIYNMTPMQVMMAVADLKQKL